MRSLHAVEQNGSPSSLQRSCGCESNTSESDRKRTDENLLIQRLAVNGEAGLDGEWLSEGDFARPGKQVPRMVDEVIHSAGIPLDSGTRGLMEPRFGHDFSRVRVHSGELAAASARALNALAYTVGNHIVLNSDECSPSTESGRKTLIHELTHVVQQNSFDPASVRDIRVGVASSPLEREAEAEANAPATPEIREPLKGRSTPVLARRGAPVPMRPPARVPARAPGRGTGSGLPGRASPRGGAASEPSWLPERFDDSLDAGLQRNRIDAYAERMRTQAERPIATLARGGQAPEFITEHGTQRVTWLGGPSGGGAVTARKREFHVLDSIEFSVARASTDNDLRNILQIHAPVVAVLDAAIEVGRLGSFSGTGSLTAIRPSLLWDEPVYEDDFDPDAEERLAVFERALRKRSEAVPALKNSRLLSQSRQRGGCRIVPISPLGDDPLSVIYSHVVTGSPFSYRISIQGTQRWAEIDALRGNTWYECKCGYRALLSGESRGDKVAEAVMAKMDKQVLNHVDIARTCGLEYRYIVSNETVADLLRSRWHGNVVIDVRPWEGCD